LITGGIDYREAIDTSSGYSISHKETKTIHSIEDQKREIGIYYKVRKEYTLLAT